MTDAPEIVAAPTQAPAADTPPTQAEGFDFSSLEANAVGDDGITPANKPSAKPAPAPEAKKPDAAPAKPDAKIEPKPDALKVDTAKAPETPQQPDDGKKKSIGYLYRETEKKLNALQQEHEQVVRELTELKSKPPTLADDPEKKQAIARLQELEQEIQLKNFEKSEKYQKEFYQPYAKAHNLALAEAQEIMVETDDGSGNVKVRAITPQEAYAVVTANSKEEATMIARKIFPNPEDADKRVNLVNTRSNAHSAYLKMAEAIQEYRTKGAEREKQERIEAEQKRTQSETQKKEAEATRLNKFKEYNELPFKNETLKDLFTAAEEDAKGKELLTKGLKAADRAFGLSDRDEAGNLVGDDGKPLDEDALIALHSGVRNKAGAFNYVAYKYRSAVSEIADLKKQLEQFKKSEPGVGSIPSERKPAGDDSDHDIYREAEKLAGR